MEGASKLASMYFVMNSSIIMYMYDASMYLYVYVYMDIQARTFDDRAMVNEQIVLFPNQ